MKKTTTLTLLSFLLGILFLPHTSFAQFVKPHPVDSIKRAKALRMLKEGKAIADSSYFVGSFSFLGIGDLIKNKDKRLHIFIKIDSNTQKIYPFGMNPDSNVVYLRGAKKVELIAMTNPSQIEKFRYRTSFKDTLTDFHWQQLQTSKIKKDWTNPFKIKIKHKPLHIFEDQKAYSLGSFNIENKKLTLQTLNLTNPKEMRTIYFYNKKPLTQPKIISVQSVIKKKESRNYSPNSISFGSVSYSGHSIGSDTTKQHNWIPKSQSGYIKFIISKTGPSKLYRVLLENTSSKYGRERPIKTHWQVVRHPSSYPNDSGGVYTNISLNEFKQPGVYKITILPGFFMPVPPFLIPQKDKASYFYVKISSAKK